MSKKVAIIGSGSIGIGSSTINLLSSIEKNKDVVLVGSNKIDSTHFLNTEENKIKLNPNTLDVEKKVIKTILNQLIHVPCVYLLKKHFENEEYKNLKSTPAYVKPYNPASNFKKQKFPKSR